MHAARNSLLPVVTWVFHMFGYAIASTVLVEVVFAWPGLGREIVSAVTTFDYPVSQAAFFLISVIIIGNQFPAGPACTARSTPGWPRSG